MLIKHNLIWTLNYNPTIESFAYKNNYNYEIKLCGRNKIDIDCLIKILPEDISTVEPDYSQWIVSFIYSNKDINITEEHKKDFKRVSWKY